jgi:hypothetical protein
MRTKTFFLGFFLAIGAMPLFAQSVQLRNLFDTGLNMGYLMTHWQNGTAESNWSTWAANAQQEWLGSWDAGSLPGIAVDIQNPVSADKKFRNLIVSLPTAGCENRWYRTKENVYQSAQLLGRAYVESTTDCSECLSLSMQKAAMELRQVGNTRNIARFLELADQLEEAASSLRKNLDEEATLRQNTRQRVLIEAVINEMKLQLLPRELQICSEQDEIASDSPIIKQTEKPAKPEENNGVIIKAGINSASLVDPNTDASTAVKAGYEGGFQITRGRRIYVGSGLSYFRYSTGEELTARFDPSQQVEYDLFFIGGFKVPAFLGVAPLNRKNLKFRVHGGAYMYFSSGMVHEYFTIGDLAFQDRSFTYLAGAQAIIGPMVADITYERGLTNMLVSDQNQDAFAPSVLTFSAGIKF